MHRKTVHKGKKNLLDFARITYPKKGNKSTKIELKSRMKTCAYVKYV